MARIAVIVAAGILCVHGLVHLMGTVTYMRLGEVAGLPYKTTILAGRWDLGTAGIQLFGALWILPALGFVGAAAALLAGSPVWHPLLVVSAILSLALTTLDWNVAYAGAIVDLAILLVLVWFSPQPTAVQR